MLRALLAGTMRSVFLLVLMTPALWAQDGAAIYKERCASCHDSPQIRVPALSAIKAMSSQAIYLALTSGAMKAQAEGMSTAQILALVRYIDPTGGTTETATSFAPTCKSASTFRADANRSRWDGWGTSVTNSRFQDAASAGLSASDVPRLKLKWAFNLGPVAVARAQPAVAGGRLFITTQTGAVYALDAGSGLHALGI